MPPRASIACATHAESRTWLALLNHRPQVTAGEQFLATLAHEICNAVGPIRSGMDLLQTEGIDEATSRWAQGLMQRQIGQLVWMVESLRDASRLRRGMIQTPQRAYAA